MTIEAIREHIAPLHSKLVNHPIYKGITTIDHLRVFMEHHVYAVWDFMSILKGMQNQLTCTQPPWRPIGDPKIRLLINQMVLVEESDTNADGVVSSQFENYIRGMQAIKANVQPITQLLQYVSEGEEIGSALTKADIPRAALQFVLGTFSVVNACEPHELAAALSFGRELVLPDMMEPLIKDLDVASEKQRDVLLKYFQRRLDPDIRRYGQQTVEIVDILCGSDAIKWDEAKDVAQHALTLRLNLWDRAFAAMYA